MWAIYSKSGLNFENNVHFYLQIFTFTLNYNNIPMERVRANNINCLTQFGENVKTMEMTSHTQQVAMKSLTQVHSIWRRVFRLPNFIGRRFYFGAMQIIHMGHGWFRFGRC
jgi:hypothetical protein